MFGVMTAECSRNKGNGIRYFYLCNFIGWRAAALRPLFSVWSRCRGRQKTVPLILTTILALLELFFYYFAVIYLMA